MKTKHKWMNKPITWGQYLKFSCVLSAIAVVIYGAFDMWIFWDRIVKKLDSIIFADKNRFNHN